MGVESGAWRRSKQGRRKRIRAGGVFLAVAAAQGVLVGVLDLTGSPVRLTRTVADASVPYYLTTERPLRPAPTAAEARPLKKRKSQTTPAANPPPPPAPNVSPPAPTAPPAAAGPLAPDYGRWTVAPGAWPEAGHGGNAMSVCDPANLASLPAAARKACAERLKSASAAGPPARRGAAPDWKVHNPLSCEPKNEPAHKLILDHCSPVGGTAVGFTLKYQVLRPATRPPAPRLRRPSRGTSPPSGRVPPGSHWGSCRRRIPSPPG